MASAIVSSWQSIVARNIDPLDAAVLTVGMIRGGTRYNIIPETVELQGTVRTLKTDVQVLAKTRMHEMASGITQAYGGTFTFDYKNNTPATINDPVLARWAEKSLVEAVGTRHVHELPPTMGAEDFAYFAQVVPGFYFRLGVHKPGTETGGLHTPTFRGDDSAIEVGIRTMSGLLLSYLHASPATDHPSAQVGGFPGKPG
jgi:amidohydrolase